MPCAQLGFLDYSVIHNSHPDLHFPVYSNSTYPTYTLLLPESLFSYISFTHHIFQHRVPFGPRMSTYLWVSPLPTVGTYLGPRLMTGSLPTLRLA